MSTTPQQQTSTNNIRMYILVGVIAIFSILGLLIAYNSGAQAEESQEQFVNNRIQSISRRFFDCQHEIFRIKSGGEVLFESRQKSLQSNLDSLVSENNNYKEQQTSIEQRIEDCEAELATERKKKTGVESGDASDEVLRLEYELKRVEASNQQVNATRMEKRHDFEID